MNPTYDFAAQVALVTGASSSMGLATTQAFAEAGASVVLADINENAVSAATDELTAAGHQALGVVCDVSDEAQVAALVERTIATFGRLDMAFNNAGIRRARHGRGDPQPADQPTWTSRRDRRGRALALQPGSQLRGRGRATGRRRLHRRLTEVLKFQIEL